MRSVGISNRAVTAALVAFALTSTWLAPIGAARAQTVSMGSPGDHWASMLQWTHIGRGEKDGAYGYVVKLRAADGCAVDLFYPRTAIDFHGQGRGWRNFKVRVATGWLYYPSRLNARSLPDVHPRVLEIEDHYQRQAAGAIAAAQAFGTVATLGTMTPFSGAVPLPRATRPAPARAPRASSTRAPHRTTPARTASTGTTSAARGGTDALSRAGRVADRGGLTTAGRALPWTTSSETSPRHARTSSEGGTTSVAAGAAGLASTRRAT